MPTLGEINRESQIWKSIIRHPAPVDRRNRVVGDAHQLLLHLHPVVDQEAGDRTELYVVHGVGDVFPVSGGETITGVLLMFYYRRRWSGRTTIFWHYAM